MRRECRARTECQGGLVQLFWGRGPPPYIYTAAAISLLLASCGGETFTPASVVDRLRVLAVQAEPPEIGPGEQSRLRVLVADPLGAGRPLWKVWLACDPEPASQFGNRCAQLTQIREPRALFENPDAATDAVRLLGTGDEVLYQAPAALFDGMPADHLARRRGLTAVILVLVAPNTGNLQEDLRAAAENTVENELVIKRLKIKSVPERNRNPILLDVRNDWGPPGLDLVAPAERGEAWFRPVIADGGSEHYLEIDADGHETEKDEPLTLYWFVTAGRWEHGKTTAADAAMFFPPHAGDEPAVPESRRITLWVVLRDPRGGASWTSRTIVLQ